MLYILWHRLYSLRPNVRRTPIAPIRFDDFYLPKTFRVVSIGAPRDIQEVDIQRREGRLQQPTYESSHEIQITGRVHSQQVEKNGEALTCPQFLREIRSYINTRDDRKLYLEDDIFHYARLARQRTAFVPYTNRQVADVQLNFSIADPHEYSDTETVSGSLSYNGNGPTNEITHTFNNEGSTDTPLYISLSITGNPVNNIAIKVYDGTSNNVKRVMILDSPGYSASSSGNYYGTGTTIIIDSRQRTITHSNTNIIHHIRSAEEWTATPVQNLPIELPPGETKVGFHNNIGNGLVTGPDSRLTAITINAKIRKMLKSQSSRQKTL